MQATPRASQGGQTYDGPYDADYVERAVADLFRAIESNLKPKAWPAAEAAPPGDASDRL